VLAFPGLFEMRCDPTKAGDEPDRWLWSCVIVTTDATGPAGDIHDRTPLILAPDRFNAWLDPHSTDAQQIYDMPGGIVRDALAVRPISTAVNEVGNNGPQLIHALDLEHPDEPLQLTLAGRAAQASPARKGHSHAAAGGIVRRQRPNRRSARLPVRAGHAQMSCSRVEGHSSTTNSPMPTMPRARLRPGSCQKRCRTGCSPAARTRRCAKRRTAATVRLSWAVRNSFG
jgi:SOS response associated peptidase (SRAP)